MKVQELKHEFVEYIPDVLDEGVLYVSVAFATVVHKCVCGCGSEVVTPLSPTDWYLTFDGRAISLNPSIGNWNFPCQSHYWIKGNQILWAGRWTQRQIDEGRMADRRSKELDIQEVEMLEQSKKPSKWQRLKSFFNR